ncbi:hypothetical protein HBI56_122630 [Parastagonospora nodorum]|uniref:Rhodopsin domain-containing protein n=1 Tax=Phaeosphaeria nodorum (strain SN15 / ATCC MYA-4574 / FGSC 10173) TaxID=321614 RepID=A0A7U2FBC2_PHANO|nr:hypothetical protein HBH56_052050 [Parastagonospora nodorum]QRD02146.1 hypothetical protein JI435_051240 [Parastagonospora nodorum SN15]KAH3935933.1 hypothetical protein HBH54_037840 [Parastagonospora nodorum]KAH3948556.1 hypothetical protein HBH53_101320 [Parastagonospora nodorum]KAH3988745.1 hypothetical protein HBH52_026550 [Parastagonospora nodorum]
MSSFEDMLLAAFLNPPDPNEPLPPANRKGTIYGIVISFCILSWIAVLFRLWVRFKVVREPGLDDLFVLLSATTGIVGTAFVCRSVVHGLGRHMLYIGMDQFEMYLKTFYIEHSIYLTQCALIKLSLLLQYLRIFKSGIMRWVCITLIAIVSLWGLAFMFVGWFPCFPIRGAWQRNIGAKCYGFGLGNVNEFIMIFKIHSSSNMVLDVLVFLTPMVIFRTPTLKIKNLVAMAGVFTCGAIVVGISIWRLYVISNTQAATYPYLDFTWWSPIMIVLSCLEIDLAIICASMPIFWPIIEKSLAAIFVSYEVDVTEERVQDEYGLAYELEHTKSAGQQSLRSVSGTSMEGLTMTTEEDTNRVPKFSVGRDPLEQDTRAVTGFQASVETRPKPKWEI